MKEIDTCVSLIYRNESELLNALYEHEEFKSLYDWKKKYETLLNAYIDILNKETVEAK